MSDRDEELVRGAINATECHRQYEALGAFNRIVSEIERLRKLLGHDYWTAGAEIDALKLEIERLRTRQSCEGDQPYICHALATARSDNERLRQRNEELRTANGWAELEAEVERLNTRLASIRTLCATQANDDGLWFRAQYASEAYLQQALRELHRVAEEPTNPHQDLCDWANGVTEDSPFRATADQPRHPQESMRLSTGFSASGQQTATASQPSEVKT